MDRSKVCGYNPPPATPGRPSLATAGFITWFALTMRLVARRLRDTARDPAHVIEMVATSLAIPPLAIYWRLLGWSPQVLLETGLQDTLASVRQELATGRAVRLLGAEREALPPPSLARTGS